MGNFAATVFTGVSTLIAAAVLGAESFGLLASLIALAYSAELLTSFSSWQGTVKYLGFEADKEKKGQLLAFSGILDIAAGLVAFLAYQVAVYFLFTFDHEDEALAAHAYGVILIVNPIGTAMGVLWSSGQYAYHAIVVGGSALVRALLCVPAIMLDGGVALWLLLWLLGEIILRLALSAKAIKTASNDGLLTTKFVRPKELEKTFPGLGRTYLSTNFQLTFHEGIRSLDVLLATLIAGPAAGGGWKLIKTSGQLFQRLLQPLAHALAPEIMKLAYARSWKAINAIYGKYFFASALLCLFTIALALLTIDPIIGKVLGAEYGFIKYPAIAYLAATGLGVCLLPLVSYFIAIDKAGTLALVTAVAATIYMAAFAYSLVYWGLTSAALISLVYWVIWGAPLILVAGAFLRSNRSLSAQKL